MNDFGSLIGRAFLYMHIVLDKKTTGTILKTLVPAKVEFVSRFRTRTRRDCEHLADL
jgi:hypothetical protein